MSSRDIVLRKFLSLESKKEIEKNRILTNFVALSGAGTSANSSEWVADIQSHWNTYVSLELGMDTDIISKKKEVEEDRLRMEYEKIKTHKITAYKSKDGKSIVVQGLKRLQKDIYGNL